MSKSSKVKKSQEKSKEAKAWVLASFLKVERLVFGMIAINTIKDAVSDISKEYGISRAYLFGSYAKNEAGADSDVDLRIDKGSLKGLFQLAGFQLALQERLGVGVDVLTTQSLDDLFLENIRGEEIMLYEQ